MREFYGRHRELILYVFFGVLTTLVGFLTYQALEHFLLPRWGGHSYLFSTAMKFVAAVAFAFVVNKLFVFRRKSWERRAALRELLTFFAMRAVSFVVVEYIAVIVAFDLIWPRLEPRFAPWWQGVWPAWLPGVAPMAAYRFLSLWCVIQAVVVVANYFFSKLVIFKKTAPAREGEDGGAA